MEKGKRGFKDLDAYKLALKVLKAAYRVSRSLPVEEKYTWQIRYAALLSALRLTLQKDMNAIIISTVCVSITLLVALEKKSSALSSFVMNLDIQRAN